MLRVITGWASCTPLQLPPGGPCAIHHMSNMLSCQARPQEDHRSTKLLLFRCSVHAAVSSWSRISSSSRSRGSTVNSSSISSSSLQQHSVPTLTARARRLLAELASVAQPLTLQPSSAAAQTAETADSVWVKSLTGDEPRAWATATEAPADDANCAQFPGCAPGSCVSTDTGFKCISCQGSLFVSKADGFCGERTGPAVCLSRQLVGSGSGGRHRKTL
jgi:hypothetical protein